MLNSWYEIVTTLYEKYNPIPTRKDAENIEAMIENVNLKQ